MTTQQVRPRIGPNARRVVVLAVISLGVITASAGAGYTAAQITSGDIKNQTIQSWDIHRNGVGADELRHGAAGWSVTGDHIRSNSVRPSDVGGHFRDAVFDRTTAKTANLGGGGEIPVSGFARLEAVPAEAHDLVTGSVTLQADGSLDRATCQLATDNGDQLARASVTLARVDHVSLVGVTTQPGKVYLECGLADASVLGVSMARAELG